jgi:hypothetical protein
MKKREKLKAFVFVILKEADRNKEVFTAKDLYEEVRHTNHSLIENERIRGFQSFLRVLNSFPDLEKEGKPGKPMIYKILA